MAPELPYPSERIAPYRLRLGWHRASSLGRRAAIGVLRYDLSNILQQIHDHPHRLPFAWQKIGLGWHGPLMGVGMSPSIVLDAFAGEGIAYGSSVQKRSWNTIGKTAGVACVDIHADDTQRGRNSAEFHSL